MKKLGWTRSAKGKSINSWKLIAFVAVFGALRFGPQLVDWFPVKPTSHEIKQLADATTMTSEAQQIFYKQTPTIQPKSAFLKECQKLNKLDKDQFLLGCYLSNGQSGKIVIESISGPHFKGMMELIAAHEMLHAAYHRLSQSERDALAPRLKKAVHRVTDRHLAKVLKKYEDTNSDRFVNELHSHLGTELDDLGDADLEQHYRRYFIDRHRVVAFAQQSKAVMNELDDRGDRLKSEIDTLEVSLKSAKQDLKAMQQDLAERRQHLDMLHANVIQLRKQVEQTDRQDDDWLNAIAQFEQMKSRYNQQVQEYNVQVQQSQSRADQFNQQVEQFNGKVKAYNEIAHEKRSFLAELDSRPESKN
jgi:DNA repair exonuclease SbcCD ATPase subunit